MTTPVPPIYCWFDTEFTSLELDSASLLQVALVVTGTDLVPIVPGDCPDLPDSIRRRNGISVYLQPPNGWEPGAFIAENMPDVVAACRASAFGVEEGDRFLATYLDAAVGSAPESIKDRPIMAGNSIHSDWFFARRDLKRFHSRLHYRLLDVSSIKTEWRVSRGGPGAELDKGKAPELRAVFPAADLEGGVAHDAYYDAQASLAELAWYRANS
ncbi:MAG: exonuclease domain-containing protein [Planctomycetota bacterium]|jgi:oligoribonuclease|nr:exonuclease domain-containing protein [Planctomycetota bacterium]MDP6939254.1 exonuclease domain-containing protein [Planctomycetota bacterium]